MYHLYTKLRVLFKVVEAYLGPYQKSTMKFFYEAIKSF